MRTKWYEESPGVTSWLRVFLTPVIGVGIGAVVCGCVGFLIGNHPDSAAIVASGCGLLSLSFGAKAWQAQAEAKTGI